MDQNTPGIEREMAKLSRIAEHIGKLAPSLHARATLARTNLTEKNLVHVASERETLACDLFRIVQEAEANLRAKAVGSPRTRIVNAAGMADGSGKSKRLYRLTVDPDMPKGAQRKRRVESLVKHPDRYLRLADAAARLGSLDPADAILRLVAGTRFEPGLDDLAADAVPIHQRMLAEAISAETRRIADRHNLSWYFETIDRQGLRPWGESWAVEPDAWIWSHRTIPGVILTFEEIACFPGTWWPKGASSLGARSTPRRGCRAPAEAHGVPGRGRRTGGRDVAALR